MHNVVILIKYIFNDDNKYYPQVLLETFCVIYPNTCYYTNLLLFNINVVSC